MSLFEACQKEDLELIGKIISDGSSVDGLDSQGRTALHYCAEHRTIECAAILLKQTTNPIGLLNSQDHEGCSPVHLACLNGNCTMTKYFCEQGADVHLFDNEKHSLVHWITVCAHSKLFDIVLNFGAPLHTPDIHGAFPIHYAAQLSVIEIDDNKTVDPDRGLEILNKFIEHHVEIDCLDGQRRTPFLWAASVGALDALRILHAAGANPLQIDKDSLGALHCAATRGHAQCIRILVDFYRCPIEGEDVNGCTALFYAVSLGHLDACRVLLELKANPNHQDKRGRTPSHCAASKGNLECLKSLINHNGDLWLKNKRGDYPVHETVLSVSLKKNNESVDFQNRCSEIIRFIFKLFPNRVNLLNNEKRTCLHLAASFGNVTMCQLLIECGGSVNFLVQTPAGNYLTAYDFARIRRQDDCAEFLIRHGGQRGKILAQIFARRIQRFYRRYKNAFKQILQKEKKETLLAQAMICLENKKLDDQTIPKIKPNKNISKSSTAEKIIIHRPDSATTIAQLQERRKLIGEELFKLRQARLNDYCIVISRSLYKILIENAFNPQRRRADEIEEYLEKLLQSYENELMNFKTRTKNVGSRRHRNS